MIPEQMPEGFDVSAAGEQIHRAYLKADSLRSQMTRLYLAPMKMDRAGYPAYRAAAVEAVIEIATALGLEVKA